MRQLLRPCFDRRTAAVVGLNASDSQLRWPQRAVRFRSPLPLLWAVHSVRSLRPTPPVVVAEVPPPHHTHTHITVCCAIRYSSTTRSPPIRVSLRLVRSCTHLHLYRIRRCRTNPPHSLRWPIAIRLPDRQAVSAALCRSRPTLRSRPRFRLVLPVPALILSLNRSLRVTPRLTLRLMRAERSHPQTMVVPALEHSELPPQPRFYRKRRAQTNRLQSLQSLHPYRLTRYRPLTSQTRRVRHSRMRSRPLSLLARPALRERPAQRL